MASSRSKLLIAFASYRDRPKHPNIFFYEHDGVAKGRIVGKVGTARNIASAEGHPSLSGDGRFCAFTFELENNTGQIYFWDRKEQKLVEHPTLNNSPSAQMGPSISSDGNLIAFSALSRPGAGQGWHVFLYDRAAKKTIDLPGLNSQTSEDRLPALSHDGRWLAFVSNRPGGVGLTDIYLYDRKSERLLTRPNLNSKRMDIEPSLSADGNLIAFTSDRPPPLSPSGGEGWVRGGGRDTAAHEYSPSLSPDGRYIAFVSERLDGEGERDIYLYDRQAQKLLPTPGLNSKADDFDPCVVVMKAAE